jgi:23S rRNA pseudouridine2457 synthase
MIIAFYKPYGVLSQFTPEKGSPYRVLAEFGFPPETYPVGRLDADSEGLLLLAGRESQLSARLLHPRNNHAREYWAQVEGTAHKEALRALEKGLAIRDYHTKPCKAARLSDDALTPFPERIPPVRFRKSIPTSWIALELTEGKNRQARQMTAAVGLPTLRLIRVRIGGFVLPFFQPGVWRVLTQNESDALFLRNVPFPTTL